MRQLGGKPAPPTIHFRLKRKTIPDVHNFIKDKKRAFNLWAQSDIILLVPPHVKFTGNWYIQNFYENSLHSSRDSTSFFYAKLASFTLKCGIWFCTDSVCDCTHYDNVKLHCAPHLSATSMLHHAKSIAIMALMCSIWCVLPWHTFIACLPVLVMFKLNCINMLALWRKKNPLIGKTGRL